MYTCLLSSAFEERDAFAALLDITDRISSTYPSVLRHTRQIQIPTDGLEILQHTPLLAGLIIEHPDPDNEMLPMPKGLPEAIFRNLVHLQYIYLVRWGCTASDVVPFLQSLCHLSSLRFLKLAYLEAEEPFVITGYPPSLRQLELAGCCDAITTQLLQALASPSMTRLEISECRDVGNIEILVPRDQTAFQQLSQVELVGFTNIATTGYLAHFTSLKHVALINAAVSSDDMQRLLRWLPATVRQIGLIYMASLDFLAPLCTWLQSSTSSLWGMSIYITFDELVLKYSEDEDHIWVDAVTTAHKLVQVAKLREIFLVPGDLLGTILSMMPDGSDEESSPGSEGLESEAGGLSEEAGDESGSAAGGAAYTSHALDTFADAEGVQIGAGEAM